MNAELRDGHRPCGLLMPLSRAVLLLATVSASGCVLLDSDNDSSSAGSSAGDASSAGFSDSCPHWSSDSRWIAFDRGPGGVRTTNDRGRLLELKSDIYVATADGRRLLRLTRTRARDEVIGWLEQPSRVVYRSRGGLFAIAPQNGAKPQRLGHVRPEDEVIALSHDGRRAFVVQGNRSPPGSDPSAGSGKNAYVVVDFRRRARHELASGAGIGDEYAAWSPDDSTLAYARSRNTYPFSELVVLRGDRVVLRKQRVTISGLAWSPDGRELAYSKAVGGAIAEGAQIWLLRPGSGSERQLTRRTASENVEPTWSRDGKQIYYDSGEELRSITPAGTNDTHIARGGSCLRLSPDGARIASTRTESAGYLRLVWSLVMVMRADGSAKQAITAGGKP